MALRAFFSAMWVVIRSPILVLGLYVLLVLITIPFAHVMGTQLADVMGPTETVSPSGYQVNRDEWQAFQTRGQGIGKTLTPSVLGFAAPLSHLSALLDGRVGASVVLLASGVFGTVWLFLLGGILERFSADPHAPGLPSFLAACRRHFLPFVALGAVVIALYAVGFALHRWALGPIYEGVSSRVDERWDIAMRAALYVLFGSLMVSFTLIVDYARIHVVHERSGVVDALRSSLLFLRRHAIAATVLVALNVVVLASLFSVYAVFELGTRGVALSNRALAVGQIFIAGRLTLMLVSAVAQRRLVELTEGGKRSEEIW